ncbi:dCTP deaminase domain-containing protein [Kitasatospora sp. NPDC101801]|uniref:dCTP deaminase n=1 Tax=Kitasatospora sp. NPDC101801 TaxID=3364103 RepID=UPI0037FAAD56
MILTREAILAAVDSGEVLIDPFDREQVSPNAYDWRLGERIRICAGELDAARPTVFEERVIPPEGMLLEPGQLYLGVTHERTGSERYAQLINGDHTIGALGIWVHVSAPLGHQGHAIHWTLEIRVARPVRVYPGMRFGKIVFLDTFGAGLSYQLTGRKYTRTPGIDISRLYEELAAPEGVS